MGRHLRIALAVLMTTAGIAIAGPTTAAFADASGTEQFTGFLVVSGVTGERVIHATSVRARGVFNGVGRIVEVPNLPTDPDNVTRDDLVFRSGALHLVSANQDFQFSLNPRSCQGTVTIHQTSRFEGGTGVFSGANGTGIGTVNASALLQRNPDGSCSTDLPPAHEIDRVSGMGTLSF
jgi:hypothetical protein